jgi:hypothetical protein
MYSVTVGELFLLYIVKLLKTGQQWDQVRGVAGFVRLLLQRNVQQGLTKLADIQRGPVF